MSILVTGGAGYIGSHTSHQLIKNGHSVVVLDNLTTGFTRLLPKGVDFVQGDVGDSGLVEKILEEKKVKTVIHFAGSIRVEESVLDPLKYYRNNTLNSHSLIQTCVKNGVEQFVFSSTAAIYGFPEKIPVSEDALPSPLNPYGTSKWMTEQMLKDVASSTQDISFKGKPFRYVALRYFNVAGAQLEGEIGQISKNATHLIKVACETICGLRQEIAIFGTDYPTPDGTCVRDYIHVEDLAAAHLKAVDYLNAGGDSQIVNCGYGRGFSVREVLETMRKVSGVSFKVREADRRLGDSPSIVADSSKIRKLFGWKPNHDDLEVICKSALRWEKKLQAEKAVN